ncbi:hypothetical protein NDU88_002363 [Pleurodeles waltl]|uniref:Uncharacterized protein n=1 Tax=Pleurodeles waltl TaxID=8319 RepID=A0AAV7W3U1_PLEWA|nr:hypothetical protein NDU88_002363 [Pleurodeles waltl]
MSAVSFTLLRLNERYESSRGSDRNEKYGKAQYETFHAEDYVRAMTDFKEMYLRRILRFRVILVHVRNWFSSNRFKLERQISVR